MRIGIMTDERGKTLDQIVGEAQIAAQAGLVRFWMGQHYAWDPLTTLAVIGQEVPGIGLGTAIVPTYPLHPLALASQALTVQAAIGNRFTLGIGLSHRSIIEGRFGHSYDRPAQHMREYLSALAPLLRGETVSYRGRTLTAAGEVTVPGATSPPLLVSALGPKMLQLTGELADGTIINWAGPRTTADHIVPTITRAASAAGRPAPQVVAMVMVCVTADEAGARDWAATHFGLAAQLPSYRAMLDREGVSGVEEVIVAGNESAVDRQFRRLVDAGVTEFAVAPIGSERERARTVKLLPDLAHTGTDKEMPTIKA